ncbi:hypothetical protein D7V83_12820, partial [bacterium 0.1xD8-71]
SYRVSEAAKRNSQSNLQSKKKSYRVFEAAKRNSQSNLQSKLLLCKLSKGLKCEKTVIFLKNTQKRHEYR